MFPKVYRIALRTGRVRVQLILLSIILPSVAPPVPLRQWSSWQKIAMRLVVPVEPLAAEHCEAHLAGAVAHACNGTTHHAASSCGWLHQCNQPYGILTQVAPPEQQTLQRSDTSGSTGEMMSLVVCHKQLHRHNKLLLMPQ